MVRRLALLLSMAICCNPTSIHAQVCCVLPTSDVSVLYANGNPYTFLEFDAAFYSVLSDSSGTIFNGGTVQESPYQNGNNTCWYNGSALAQYPVPYSPYGDTWTIAGGDVAGQQNTFGYDWMGLPASAVNDIREEGYDSVVGIPCTYTVYQSLAYSCSSSATYKYYWDYPMNAVLYYDHEVVSRGDASATINY